MILDVLLRFPRAVQKLLMTMAAITLAAPVALLRAQESNTPSAGNPAPSESLKPATMAPGNGTKPVFRRTAERESSKTLKSTKPMIGSAMGVIEHIQASDVGQNVQVRIVGSGAPSCTPFQVDNPDRLVLDCPRAQMRVQRTSISVDLDPVRAVRVGQFKTDVVRVVIDLEGHAPYTIRADGNTLTVVFDLLRRQASRVGFTSKLAGPAPRLVKREGEQSPSVIPPVVPDLPLQSELVRNSDAVSAAELLPSIQSASLPPPERPPDSAQSSDLPSVRRTDSEAGVPAERVDSAPVDQDFVIGPQDVLAINVWHEPEFSRSVPVRPDGKISLPLIGELKVSGLTARLLETRLSEELKDYILNPQVTVIIQEIHSHKFYILGMVERPGAYSLTSSTTVLEALAAVGGFRDFAKVKKIYVLRHKPDDSRDRIPFNFKAAVNGKKSYQDIKLQDGDTIVVP